LKMLVSLVDCILKRRPFNCSAFFELFFLLVSSVFVVEISCVCLKFLTKSLVTDHYRIAMETITRLLWILRLLCLSVVRTGVHWFFRIHFVGRFSSISHIVTRTKFKRICTISYQTRRDRSNCTSFNYFIF